MVNTQHAVDAAVLKDYEALRKTLLKLVLRNLATFAVEGDWLKISVSLINNELEFVNQILMNSSIDDMPLESNSGQQLTTKYCIKRSMVKLIEKSQHSVLSKDENDLLNALRKLVCLSGLLDK